MSSGYLDVPTFSVRHVSALSPDPLTYTYMLLSHPPYCAENVYALKSALRCSLKVEMQAIVPHTVASHMLCGLLGRFKELMESGLAKGEHFADPVSVVWC